MTSAPDAEEARRPPERDRVAVQRREGSDDVTSRASRRRARAGVTVTAMVLSNAVPIEPPICWVVFTSADAAPASRGSTAAVALAIAGAKISPSPSPKTISPGRT